MKKPEWVKKYSKGTKEPKEQMAAELLYYMSRLSEKYYSAGWLIGLEDVLWASINDSTPHRFVLEAHEREKLRELAAKAGGWGVWDETLDEEVVVAWESSPEDDTEVAPTLPVKPYILAIDDDPGRYVALIRILGDRMEVKVACCRSCVEKLLPNAVAVMLDHDITESACTCNQWSTSDNTRIYLYDLKERNVPVIITSCSDVENRNWLYEKLYSFVPCLQATANYPDHVAVWVCWLYSMRVI